MRTVDDLAYMSYLPSDMYRNRYMRWKNVMLGNIEAIVASFSADGVDATMQKFSLTPKDIALLVRLKYLSDDEVEQYSLRTIECGVPI